MARKREFCHIHAIRHPDTRIISSVRFFPRKPYIFIRISAIVAVRRRSNAGTHKIILCRTREFDADRAEYKDRGIRELLRRFTRPAHHLVACAHLLVTLLRPHSIVNNTITVRRARFHVANMIQLHADYKHIITSYTSI